MSNRGNGLRKLAHRDTMKRERRQMFQELEAVFAHLEATAPELVNALDDFVYLSHTKGERIRELQNVICNQREHNAALDNAYQREKDTTERLKGWIAGLNETIHNQRKHLTSLHESVKCRNEIIERLAYSTQAEKAIPPTAEPGAE